MKNEIKFKSLTSEFFSQQQIENCKYDSKKPHERLSDIFDGKEKASMLSEQFNIKAIIPKPVKGPITKNSVEDFTNKSQNTVNSSASAKKRLRKTASRLY